jgi:hypothetical protein
MFMRTYHTRVFFLGVKDGVLNSTYAPESDLLGNPQIIVVPRFGYHSFFGYLGNFY